MIASHDLLIFFRVAIKASSLTVNVMISAVQTIQTSFNNLDLLLDHIDVGKVCV